MITSTANNKVKRLTALGQKAKARREEGVFIAEGLKMFLEAPKEWIREVYVSESFLRKFQKDGGTDIANALAKTGYEVVSDEVFRKISDTQTPQGILSVLQQPRYELEKVICEASAKKQLFVILEDIQDPGNLGTILRAGEGAGIDGVIMTKNTVDIFNPKVIRSTMGSIYRVPFFITERLDEVIVQLKNNGVAVYAAHLEDSTAYDSKDYTKAAAFLIGNEGSGLRRETADLATAYIKIPMQGQVESLNAAAATTILMYEAARQRRKGSSSGSSNGGER